MTEYFYITIIEKKFVDYQPLDKSDAFKILKKRMAMEEFICPIKYGGDDTKTFMGTGPEFTPEEYRALKASFEKGNRTLWIYGLEEIQEK